MRQRLQSYIRLNWKVQTKCQEIGVHINDYLVICLLISWIGLIQECQSLM